MPTKAELITLVEKLRTRMGEYSDGWRWSPNDDEPLLDELHSALKPVVYPPTADEYPPDTDIIGETLLDVIQENIGRLKAVGWNGAMDSPTEVVTDLLGLLEESNARMEYLTRKAHSLSGVTVIYSRQADENGRVDERGFRLTSFHNKGAIFDTLQEAIDDAIQRDQG